MMQSITLSSGSMGARNPTPGGIPPFSYHSATGVELLATQAAAQFLAARIVGIWAIKGHEVDAWVVQMTGASIKNEYGTSPSWGVRTDLVNGMPSGLGRAAWERKFGRGV
jgi:hypothetical protein